MVKILYEKIVEMLASISVDKYMHVITCIIISGMFMHILPMSLCANVMFSIILTIGVGVGKEVIDYKNYGSFNTRDLLSDVIGALIGTLIAI